MKDKYKIFNIYDDLAIDYLEDGTTDEILFTGLASEVGEVLSERMKEVRISVDLDRSKEIIDELSDILWYITVIGHRRGTNISQLMKHNLDKLERRALNKSLQSRFG